MGRGSACIGRRRGVWPARACLHSCGGRRGSAQAAERIARAGTERLACGRKAQASTGFGLHAHDCARVSVLCAGCRLSKGVGKRAQAPTRDRSQACFFRVIMRALISLHILPAALVRLCAWVREGVRVRGSVRGRAYAHVCVRVRAQMDMRAVLAACVPRPAQRRFAQASRGVWKSCSQALERRGQAKILLPSAWLPEGRASVWLCRSHLIS